LPRVLSRVLSHTTPFSVINRSKQVKLSRSTKEKQSMPFCACA